MRPVVQPTYINDEHSIPTNSYWATLGITVYSSTVTFNPFLDKNVRGSLEHLPGYDFATSVAQEV